MVWSLGLQLAIVALPFLSPPQWLLNLTLEVLRPLWGAMTAAASAFGSFGSGGKNGAAAGQATSKRTKSIRKKNRKKKSTPAATASGDSVEGKDSQKSDEVVQDMSTQKPSATAASEDGDGEWTTVSGAPPAPAPVRQKKRPRKKVKEPKPDPFAYFNVTSTPKPNALPLQKDAVAAPAEHHVRGSENTPAAAHEVPKEPQHCTACAHRADQTTKHKEELDNLELQLSVLRNKLQAQRQRHRQELEREVAKAQQRAARQLELQRELLSDVQRQYVLSAAAGRTVH